MENPISACFLLHGSANCICPCYIKFRLTKFDFLIRHTQLKECAVNVVAHVLAKRAKSILEFQVWSEEVPADVSPIVTWDIFISFSTIRLALFIKKKKEEEYDK